MVRVGGEQPVVANEVYPEAGHQGGQARHEVQRVEHQMGGAIAEGAFELVDVLPFVVARKAAVSQSRHAPVHKATGNGPDASTAKPGFSVQIVVPRRSRWQTDAGGVD